MILFRYFLGRWVRFVGVINVLLAFLFNFIEFFEKLMRVKNVSVGTIAHFIGLNFFPSFIDIVPLASWLGTCFLIKELFLQHEWDALLLVNVGIGRIMRWLLVGAICIAGITCVLKEKYIAPLTLKTERFRLEAFNQVSTQKLMNKWESLAPHLFCHFNFLDLCAQEGKDITFVYFTPRFSIEKIVRGNRFTINPQQQTITVFNLNTFFEDSHEHRYDDQITLSVPSFFSQLRLYVEPITLINLAKNLLFNAKNLPQAVSDHVMLQFFKRVIFYLQIALYPLFTLIFFCLLWHALRIKWVLLFAPYILFLLHGVLSELLIKWGMTVWVYPLIFFVMSSIIVVIGRRLWSA